VQTHGQDGFRPGTQIGNGHYERTPIMRLRLSGRKDYK